MLELLISQMLIGHLLTDNLPQAFAFFLKKIWKDKKTVWCHDVVQSYRAMTNVTCELVWVRDLLIELDFTYSVMWDYTVIIRPLFT